MLEMTHDDVSRMKIWLETQHDIVKFVNIATGFPENVTLHVIDDKGMCVNARSIMGMMYAQEFKHMWLVSNSDRIHVEFSEFEKG